MKVLFWMGFIKTTVYKILSQNEKKNYFPDKQALELAKYILEKCMYDRQVFRGDSFLNLTPYRSWAMKSCNDFAKDGSLTFIFEIAVIFNDMVFSSHNGQMMYFHF
jgi:hypothetical protein